MFFEPLESRVLLSAFTPAQIKHAYHFDRITFPYQGITYNGSGRGETIAIVDAFSAPTIISDLTTFDATYSLPNTDIYQNFALSIATPQGTPGFDAAWAQETTMDVEWAHAIAPKAHILLVQAASASLSDLFAAVDFARKQQGVGVVSMSWTGAEFDAETSYDSIFTTPVGHRPVTFIAATGDHGFGAAYPASSPNVISVGGTSLTLDINGNYGNETAWSSSGGGRSTIEGTYTPTVAYDADPASGFMIYDTTSVNGQFGWMVDAGTSAGAPQWAALIAIADQGRSYVGLHTLDGVTQTRPALFSIPATDFHDIITGNNGVDAHVGYDRVTGLGTPYANRIVNDLVAYGAVQPFAVASVISSRAFAAPVISTRPAVGLTNQAVPASDDWLKALPAFASPRSSL